MAAQNRECALCGASLAKTVPKSQTWCNPCRAKARVRNVEASAYRFLQYKMDLAKKRAKRRDLTFGLDMETLYEVFKAQDGKCALTGLPMTWKTEEDMSVSIDRIDPSQGYDRGNVRLVCTRINIMRSDLPDKDFYWWCKVCASANAD